MRNCQIRGRLGSDAELQHTASGTAVCKFSVAVNERRGDAVEVHWFRCNAWAEAAERLAPQLKKGTFVSIHGRLDSRQWKDKDNKPHSAIEISAFIVDVLKPREQNQEDEPLPF